MSVAQYTTLVLIGCGSIFDAASITWPRIGGNTDHDGVNPALQVLRLTTTDNITTEVAAALAELDSTKVRVFAAIDSNALNHARLDAYAGARLRGFKCATLIHPDAIVEPDIQIGENCWIGAGAIVGSGVRIGNNTFIGAGARIDGSVQIGNSTWIGPGAALGHNARIGTHCVLGADVKIAAGVVLGRHCVVERPGAYAESLPDGSFIDPLFDFPVRIFGKAARSTG